MLEKGLVTKRKTKRKKPRNKRTSLQSDITHKNENEGSKSIKGTIIDTALLRWLLKARRGGARF